VRDGSKIAFSHTVFPAQIILLDGQFPSLCAVDVAVAVSCKKM